jgi:hypothetical protein
MRLLLLVLVLVLVLVLLLGGWKDSAHEIL